MLLIFCDKISERLNYTISIVFDLLYTAEYRLTDDQNEFERYNGPKLSYSLSKFDNVLCITPSGLLDEHTIVDDIPKHGSFENITHLYPNSGELLPYDIFSAVFYMLSRYEEYGDFQGDKHGRYPLEQSLAFKLKFHKKAIVHHWSKQLVDGLNRHYPSLIKNNNSYKIEIGLDIDNAYAYKHKNLFRTFGALIRSILNPAEFTQRLSVLTGSQKDPYDNYEYIFTHLNRFKTDLKTFFLCANYGMYDKNISPNSKAFTELVSRAQKSGEIGIHPSYASNTGASLASEIKSLNTLSGNEVTISRQHFLMLTLPKTYLALMHEGIKNDYSMGYAESSGFRAGMAIPYPFYNLKEEKITNLIIHPFAFMESCYIHYQPIDIDEIKSEIRNIIDEVRSVSGVFHAVWHNEYLGGKQAKKWREIFEFMLKQGSIG